MIETRGLTKLFKDKKRGEIRAVDSVSFAANRGRFTVCWAPTELEKPLRCGCWRRYWSPATEPPRYAGMT